MTPRIAVVGGGVSGLTAAYALRRRLGADAAIDVYDAADRPGGLLCTRHAGPVAMDVGAEAFIIRRPEALALVTELGLAGEVVSPGPLRPAIWSGGRLHPMPRPAVMGVPDGAAAMGALIGDADRALIDGEAARPLNWTPGAAVSVGALVRDRFGDAVVARSVDPMLGGVYSARADDLGLAETVPALAAALDAGADSLTSAVRGILAAPAPGGPVFGALRGGYRRLVEVLSGASGASILPETPVHRIEADRGGYVLDAAGAARDYDAVIVAVPPWRAATLLAAVAPESAATLSQVPAAGSAVVGCVLAPGTALPGHSGILVASDAGMRSKAVTLSSQKWPHLAESGPPVLRVSFGRLGEPVTADDDTLLTWAAEDLATYFAGAGLAAPVIEHTVVQRWPEGLPQYAPGHLAAMAGARDSLPAGLALAGAAFDGVGVPACIGSARRAAARIVDHLPA
ncbi:protoporphyrinogen oxidase [Gordonia sp. (in: high G+C Gram-positive bacteria)]|uniref:protoporphyrinogen oxidase n=1 Tax=Gordonia sp. (in: high G+C Gram-positive bacteria) TaxID=84139 RepID=UPI0026376071|nr:protoporphyrinogen oxidase [Gordonia sp. (in: high G+C Gram-positive bacteria)]